MLITGLFLISQLSLSAQPDAGIPGFIKPKGTKQKPPKIKYQFHEGMALLKTGLILEGKFRYTEVKNEVPQYQFQEFLWEDTVKKKRIYDREKKYVSLSMIDHMVLSGAEKGFTEKRDSSRFEWIEYSRDLFRKVRGGTISVYDNSRIVNESYDYLPDYTLLAYRPEFGYKVLYRVADLEAVMSDQPYFLQSARITNRYTSQDFRVILYLIALFNEEDPMRVLKWKDMTIKFKRGKMRKGKGYIQPLDMRNEHIKGGTAYVHFYDGEKFHLYNHRDIEEVSVDGLTYKGGLYNVVDKHFFGKPWTYGEQEYVVVKRIVNSNNYFFRAKRKDGTDLVILKPVGNGYIRPLNELELRKAYLTELK